MREALFQLIQALFVFCGVLVITLVMSTGMTFLLRIGPGPVVRLGRVARHVV